MGEGMYCILAFARIVATTVEFHLSVGNLIRGFLMHVLSDAQASDCQKNFAFRMLRETSLIVRGSVPAFLTGPVRIISPPWHRPLGWHPSAGGRRNSECIMNITRNEYIYCDQLKLFLTLFGVIKI